MSRFLTVVCVLAVAALICAPAFAEVQNVKVSGDITVRGLVRENYDLDKNDSNGGNSGTNASNNSDTFFMQNVGVNVDADLTDNVSTAVRLISQRDWNQGNQTSAFDVTVDTAYVTLKEMIYAPLTLTIGRQDLWFGRGFVVGANLKNPNSGLSALEYTENTAFDAVKATIDLAPWKLDGFYSRINDRSYTTTSVSSGRKDLFGANTGYKFDQYNAESEIYYFGKTDKTAASNASQVNTYGLRGSLEPITNLTVGAEGALQRGRYSDINGGNYDKQRQIRAYAYNLYGKYNFADVTWKPTLGLEWISLSGEKNLTDSSKRWGGWDAMYRGKIDNSIRDYQNWLYNTRARIGNTSSAWDQDSGLSNQNSLLVTGTVAPIEDVTLKGSYAHFWLNEKPTEANRGTLQAGDEVGDEVDLLLTYDYTEDVSFGLLAAWFMPGKIFPSGQNDTATDVVGSMKVAF